MSDPLGDYDGGDELVCRAMDDGTVETLCAPGIAEVRRRMAEVEAESGKGSEEWRSVANLLENPFMLYAITVSLENQN